MTLLAGFATIRAQMANKTRHAHPQTPLATGPGSVYDPHQQLSLWANRRAPLSALLQSVSAPFDFPFNGSLSSSP